MVLLEERDLVGLREGPASQDDLAIGERAGGWLDAPHQEPDAVEAGESRQVLAADGQKDAPALSFYRRRGARYVRHFDPGVAVFPRPGRTQQLEARHARLGAGLAALAAI